MGRKGDWIQLISGRQFWPLDPRPEEIDIHDIAWSLSMQCRYGGHCQSFYSVAEHSIHVSAHLPDELALWGLLHDAAEAYLVDLPRPVKRCIPQYSEIEVVLEQVIAERFGLPWPMPKEVKVIDTAMLFLERDQLLAPPPVQWEEGQAGAEVLRLERFTLPCWEPGKARWPFLDRFQKLTGAQRWAV